VKYYSESSHFTCDCGYTQFSGFICRHIFRSAIQLNLEELPTSLFYERWRKDPSEKNLINAYTNFYSIITSTSTSTPQHSSLAFNNESNDFQYMLTRLLQKVQRLVIQNSEAAETLYTSINEIYNFEIEKINKIQTQNSKVTPAVKNPLVVHGKGRPSNKRFASTAESTSKSSNKKKRKINENTSKPQELIINNNNGSTQNIQPLREIQSLNILPSQQYRCPSPPPIQYQFFSETDFLSNELNIGKWLIC
jgi:hypothetical protein